MTAELNNEEKLMSELIKYIELHINDSIELALGEGIRKGFILVRQSNPVLIKEKDQDEIKLHHSVVIDYLGAEKIDQLQKQVETLQKINGDLHRSLTDFYEKTRPNRWLQNQNQN